MEVPFVLGDGPYAFDHELVKVHVSVVVDIQRILHEKTPLSATMMSCMLKILQLTTEIKEYLHLKNCLYQKYCIEAHSPSTCDTIELRATPYSPILHTIHQI